ncbi:MAG: hypothetical protein L0287_25560 [Anaerolineae bacterium]|nr:hypothetical protein [Anaerolineae bacterium]
MSSSNLIRWGGLAAVFAGVSLIIQQLYALVSPDPTTGGWLGTHTLGYIGLAFGLLGQVSVYAAQQDRISNTGTIGFILGFLGNALTAGAAFMNTFIVPVLTTSAPELISPTGPLFSGPLGIIVLLGSLLVTVGFIMFGIATARAKVLPSTAAWLVVFTAWFGIAAIFAPAVFAIAGAIFGFANAWLGWAVWLKKS